MRNLRLRYLCLLFAALTAGCEDLPAGPGGIDALSGSGAARVAGLSLEDLFAAAVFRIQRDAGADSMNAVLETWRNVDRTQGRAEARRIEARTILGVFGPGVVQQAGSVVDEAFRDTQGEMAGAWVDAGRARVLLDESGRHLERALRLADTDPVEALLALDDAAGGLAELRTSAVAAPTLESLWTQALERAPGEAAAMRAADAQLAAAVEDSQRDGDVGRRYDALQARRDARSAFVARVLGPRAAETLLADIDERLGRVAPELDRLEDAGADVGRDRRMLDAVQTIAERARRALDDGDPGRAVDLAVHAADLAEELQRRVR